MTWVKICGTTNLEDALTAVEAGADAVGFVFYDKSPRRISVDAAGEIANKLPQGVEKIGVFVLNGEIDPSTVLLQAGLTGTQTYFSFEGQGRSQHGSAIGTSLLPNNGRFLTALPMNLVGADEAHIQQMAADFRNWGKNLPPDSPVPPVNFTVVLDSGDLCQPGGTGKKFDWKKAVPVAEGMRQGGVKLVVAGGLTPENVAEAIDTLRPFGVDVVSGVEASPGKKDPNKVRAFMKAVRDIDREMS